MSIVSKIENRIKVVLLFGPTGVGKTEVLQLFDSDAIEVISTDSQAVYLYMDVGTAKPEIGLTDSVSHHCLSFVDPRQQFNVGEFVKLADSLVQQITGRCRVPFLVGGTAFYFKSFAFGMPETPKSDPGVRADLKIRLEKEGVQNLFVELNRVDPVYAREIGSRDVGRIIRALEVYELSGRPLSCFLLPDRLREDYEFLLIGLNRPREELYLRIDKRVEGMFKNGLCNEVKNLLAKGYTWDHPGMKAIGYREFSLWAQGEMALGDVQEEIKRNTRKYAKRQITFFRSLPSVRWFHPDDETRITESVGEFLRS